MTTTEAKAVEAALEIARHVARGYRPKLAEADRIAETLLALSARVERLKEALSGIVLVCGSTGDSFEDFEEQAEAFYKETGWLRPGKDVPAALGGEDRTEARAERYSAWVKAKVEAARTVLKGEKLLRARAALTPKAQP